MAPNAARTTSRLRVPWLKPELWNIWLISLKPGRCALNETTVSSGLALAALFKPHSGPAAVFGDKLGLFQGPLNSVTGRWQPYAVSPRATPCIAPTKAMTQARSATQKKPAGTKWRNGRS
jgi:hypothetical protein